MQIFYELKQGQQVQKFSQTNSRNSIHVPARSLHPAAGCGEQAHMGIEGRSLTVPPAVTCRARTGVADTAAHHRSVPLLSSCPPQSHARAAGCGSSASALPNPRNAPKTPSPPGPPTRLARARRRLRAPALTHASLPHPRGRGHAKLA